jgi:molybdopterin-binding protein
MKLSARNQLSGTVTRVNEGTAIANVAAQQLGLAEGKAVTAIIKASDVILAAD